VLLKWKHLDHFQNSCKKQIELCQLLSHNDEEIMNE
jgi:hypothetical protein